MANTTLLDNFVCNGNDMDSFIKKITEISDATEVLSAKGKEITFLSLCTVPQKQQDGKLVFYVLSDDYVEDFVEFGEKLRIGAFDIDELGKELADELKEGTGLMAVINNEKYIISRSALTTLCQRACISGDTTVNRSNLARDLHLADGIFSRNDSIRFVYRTCGGVNKIFAAFSSDFVLCKQDIITRAMKHEDFPFKDYSVRSYKIDNFTTELELDLPNKIGITIKNSDVGVSSLIVRSVYRENDTSIICSEHSLRHDKGMSFEKFMHNTLAQAAKSLEESTINKDMQKLLEINVMDYTNFNEYNPFHKNENIMSMEEIIITATYELLGKILSRKSLKTITRSLIGQIDATKQYTYYDVAMMMFSIPDILNLDQAPITNARKALSDFPSWVLEAEEKTETKLDIAV